RSSDLGRTDDLLEQQLEDVRERLEDAHAHVHGPVAHVHPADELALPDHVERHRDDHRHGDGQDLQHDPQRRAQFAQAVEPLAQRTDRVDQQLVHAFTTSTRPAPSGAVAPWPPSIHAAPAATRASTTAGRVAVPCAPLTLTTAPDSMPAASAGLSTMRGATLSGCACSAAARRTTASVR